MQRLLGPTSVAIVGLSADPAKHGGRVLGNLRRLGFSGEIWGVNPGRPEVEGAEVFASLEELPGSPDLVVCAVPASVIPVTVRSAGAVGAGGVVVFAGGFAEVGADGARLQAELVEAARSSGVRVLGPNSGGIIRPGIGLAASFLTCLDRPAHEMRTGPVGLVTQSGGTGSYVHNIAAANGSGMAVSISTGNEADLGMPDGIDALVGMDEVEAIALVIETARDGAAFIEAVRRAHAAGKPVVACRIGSSRRGQSLMATHTGAMAGPAKVLDGVLDSLGVTIAETPEEMFAIAEVMARTPALTGSRTGIVTHSGGIAIMLTDLAEKHGLALPTPSDALRAELEPLLQLGSSDNPLDMGGIIGGAGRYAEVVDRFATSGDYDCVLAVSTAHPRAHTVERVEGMLALETPVPVVHLWMAGDVGEAGLTMLREADRPVTTEPRAAIRALAGMWRLAGMGFDTLNGIDVDPIKQPPRTEHDAKQLLSRWGLPVVEGGLAATADEAAALASSLGGRLVMKVSSPDIAHKTEVGGVVLGLVGEQACREAFDRIIAAVRSARPSASVEGVRLERMSSGVEVIVGMVVDPVFGPMALVGLGGVAAEGLGAERMAPAPVQLSHAIRMVESIPGLAVSLRRHGDDGRAFEELAGLLCEAGRRFVAAGLTEFEMNPVAWTGQRWEILDVVMK
jgi:acetate---CoA ligase (ADP-forming)